MRPIQSPWPPACRWTSSRPSASSMVTVRTGKGSKIVIRGGAVPPSAPRDQPCACRTRRALASNHPPRHRRPGHSPCRGRRSPCRMRANSWSMPTSRAPGGIGRARHSRIGRHGTCERNPTHRWSGPGAGRGGARGGTAVGRVGRGRGCRGRPLADGRAERQGHERQLALRARRRDRLGGDAHHRLVPVPGLVRERRRHRSPEGQGAGRGRGQGARPGRRPRSPDGQLHDRRAAAVRSSPTATSPLRPAPRTTSSRRPAPTTRAASGSWSSAAAAPRSAGCAGSSRTARTRWS